MYAFASDATFDFSSLRVSDPPATPRVELAMAPEAVAHPRRRSRVVSTMSNLLAMYIVAACLVSSAVAWAGATRNADGKPYVVAVENMLFDPGSWRLRSTLSD